MAEARAGNGHVSSKLLREVLAEVAKEKGLLVEQKKVRALVGDDDGDDPAWIVPDRILRLSPDLVREDPPVRQYMLRDANTGQGVYVRGRVGLLAAAGGTGKTWAATQLAIAQATGATWFGAGGWAPTQPGRVLFLAGEEDELEVRRMLHFAARASSLNSDALELMAKNLDAVPLAGADVSLSGNAHDAGLPMTHFAVLLRAHLRKAAKIGRPYTLVILDPLSRFEGPEVEKDAVAATRFVQVVETFTATDCGRPSAIIACHTRKAREGDDNRGADSVRGTSAIKDASRWVGRLEQQERKSDSADLLTLKIVKANGVPPQRRPLVLCRDSENEGALRIATPSEIDSNEDVSGMVKSEAQELADYCDRVVTAMVAGEKYSRDELIELCGRRGAVLAGVRKLLRDKRIVEPKKGVLILPPAASVPAVPESGNLFQKSTSSSVPTPSSPPDRGEESGNRGGHAKEIPQSEASSSHGSGTGNRPEKGSGGGKGHHP